ncbi:MAG: tetratricopeptide repeat protein [Candidatus Absconditabacterales bacterium]|nr:tetratricopeptide repeat protein [Candidatus Absconditabacterales bacterium]
MITPAMLESIEALKKEKRYDEAIALVNTVLARNPNDRDALLQIADIQYRKGDMDKAKKAVDFYNYNQDEKDPMGWYLKGVIEMEKNEWEIARKFFWKAMELSDGQNHEIMRCFGLCEYRYGNRTKGLDYLEKSYKINNKDAEIIYNLLEVYLLEHNHNKANALILHYRKSRDSLVFVDKPVEFYDEKIGLFEQFLKKHQLLKK